MSPTFISHLITHLPAEKRELVSNGHHSFGELYDFRMVLTAAFFNSLSADAMHKTYKSQHHHESDTEMDEGWFVTGAVLHGKPISFHYEMKLWDLFHVATTESSPAYEPYTSAEAFERLVDFVRNPHPKQFE